MTASALTAYIPQELNVELLETLSLAPVEAEFRTLVPSSMSQDFLNKCSNLVEETINQEMNGKVIQFPSKQRGRSYPIRWYATAAAVALIGLFSGFWAVPSSDNSDIFAQSNLPELPDYFESFSAGSFSNGELLNVSTNSTLLKADDEGLVPNLVDKTFYQAISITSMESYTMENDYGEKFQIQRPVKRTVFVPAHTD